MDCIELATFYIGDKWLGINAEHVDEAVNSAGLTTIPGSPDYVIGKFVYNNELITVIDIRTQLRLPRITSYNVCYTKLLRDAGARRRENGSGLGGHGAQVAVVVRVAEAHLQGVVA